MKRLAVIGSLLCGTLAVAACSSSSAPKANPTTFAGSWVGYVLSDTANITATQTGTAFTGTGTLFSNSNSTGVTFIGTSTPPSISGSLTALGSTLSFTGNYVTPDSIVGTLTEGSNTAPFILIKQQ
jgi:type 1 fimbria pilin